MAMKYTKLPQNGRKIYQLAIKYTNIFHCKIFQNLPEFGFLVSKYTIWQPWLQRSYKSERSLT
jgi:hypothetical protein